MSLDLRERIVTGYNARQGTREEVARRFGVSVGMMKKLQQRRRTNELGHRHRFRAEGQDLARVLGWTRGAGRRPTRPDPSPDQGEAGDALYGAGRAPRARRPRADL